MSKIVDTAVSLFKDFALDPAIQQVLDKGGFETPTEIQAKAIPLLLAEDPTDFHGQAQTGTGKTLAFGIPLLHRIDRSQKHTQALVVAPTRELAVQICDSLRPMAAAIGVSLEPIYGGVSMESQLQRIRRGVQIVVGTPGRVIDHMRRGSLNFDKVKILVLDEADIMLDMGFKEDIDALLEELPENRAIWLFSATVKGGIYQILRDHMKNPHSVRVSKEDVVAQSTRHYFCTVPQQSRLNAVCRFIECSADFYGFIFCQTKVLASQIAEQLLRRGYRVGALHGDLSQAQRDIIIKRFRAKELSIVVATDVAARGIDVANLTHVINFSLPEDQESYIHRAGRTGRAGREGVAITFINKHDMRSIRDMQRKFNVVIEPLNVPDRDAILAIRMQSIQSYVAQVPIHESMSAARCNELVAELSDDACRRALSHTLYDMFLKSLDNDKFSETPNLDAAGSGAGEQRGLPAGIAEFTLNVGSDDGVQREDIVAILENKQIQLEHVSKIRILKRCTFIHVTTEQLEGSIAALNQTIIAGRTVRASRVRDMGSSSERGGFRSREGRPRSGGRSSYSGRRREGGYGERSEYHDRRRMSRPDVYQPGSNGGSNRPHHTGGHYGSDRRRTSAPSGFGNGASHRVEYSEHE